MCVPTAYEQTVGRRKRREIPGKQPTAEKSAGAPLFSLKGPVTFCRSWLSEVACDTSLAARTSSERLWKAQGDTRPANRKNPENAPWQAFRTRLNFRARN